MMQSLDNQTVTCPYCGEAIDVLIDPSDIEQEYIEDCQVCCRPIVFSIQLDAAQQINLTVRSENDSY